MEMTDMEQIEYLEQKIRNLESQLSSNASPIGDWKIAKCMEYIQLSKEIPYDLAELGTQRQAIRDQINELQAQIDNLQS